MSAVLTPEEVTKTTESTGGRRRWLWIGALIAVAAVVGIVIVVGAGSDGGPTHEFEFNGTLEDELGGPAAVASDGTLTDQGYVFDRRQGLSFDIELGESFVIETRFRLDEGAAQRLDFAKVFDFRDRTLDAGLYVYEEETLVFYFSNTCGEVVDKDQGCESAGATRQPLYIQPNSFEMGTFTTLRFERDGDGSVSLYLDEELQTWLPRRAESAAGFERVDAWEDYNGEATLRSSTFNLFHDDSITANGETGIGEIDYIHFTVR